MLSDKLVKLYNTLGLIETKGENTKTMAQCLLYLEGIVAEAQANEAVGAQQPEIIPAGEEGDVK